MLKAFFALGASGLALFAGAGVAHAGAPGEAVGVEDIVVTAQKRQESVNKVPMSISAVDGDRLAQLGVSQASDLVKVVPGFNYTESAFGTPVYTLRGVGFYETSIGAKPTVSVYTDEVPLPFSVLARGATLDLARVEVLKGPQGTLFGQNATGGAINYIAAKPTDEIAAGADLSVASFGAVDFGGFLSGPISSTLKARFAFKTEQGGAWQRNYDENGDRIRGSKLGDRNFWSGRLLLDWDPSASVRFKLNLNGFLDKGDEQAAQFYRFILFTPGTLDFIPEGLQNYQRPPEDNRAAGWTPALAPSRDHKFGQASLRSEFDISDNLTVTSITAYSDYTHRQEIDPDGTTYYNYNYRTDGRIKAFSEELRLSGDIGALKFIVGANYNWEKTKQRDNQGPYIDSGPAYQLTGLGVPPFFTYYQQANQRFETKAVFGNIDYELSDTITLHAGARYTDAKIDFSGCTYDDGTLPGSGLYQGFGAFVNYLRGLNGLAPVSISPGMCVTIDPSVLEFLPIVKKSLNQTNTSWRVGVDFKPSPTTLLYANVSRGYKSGSFPLLSASDVSQFNPVKQEAVTAYEVGAKATLFNRLMQLNAAVFYYDYKDKQLKGRTIADPNIFGPLEVLINVPKSRILGAEGQVTLVPAQGLRMSLGGTYIDSKIKGDFSNITSYGDVGNFGGEPFAYTPKYQASADLEYRFPINSSSEVMFGSNMTYQSKTNAAFGQLPVLDIGAYTLVDFRAGIGATDKTWTLTAFMRNAFDKYYWTNASKILDTTVRYTGRPRTIGLTFAVRR